MQKRWRSAAGTSTVRVVRPVMKELDAYHQVLYTVYHKIVPEKRLADLPAAAAQLHGGRLRVYHTDDLIGVEIGGAVKNVLAIAVGEATAKAITAHGVAVTAMPERFTSADLARRHLPAGARRGGRWERPRSRRARPCSP